MPRQIGAVEEESTGLVAQDSLEDELPYVPTTLPEERTLGVSIIPVRERVLMDVKMCPLDRPRSTTPLNPSYLEEYCSTDDSDHLPNRGDKLRISLPRKEVREASCTRSKSPRRTSNASGKSWFEFAEQGIGVTTTTASTTICSPSAQSTYAGERKDSLQENTPPLPPRKAQNTSEWINFDNIPEKRKPPKRITTLPHKNTSSDISNAHHIQYNFVNPEDCQCECHEVERDADSGGEKKEGEPQTPDDTVPLLESDPDDTVTGSQYR